MLLSKTLNFWLTNDNMMRPIKRENHISPPFPYTVSAYDHNSGFHVTMLYGFSISKYCLNLILENINVFLWHIAVEFTSINFRVNLEKLQQHN